MAYTYTLLWTSKNKRWTIGKVTSDLLVSTPLQVIDNTTGHDDWPMQYSDNTVAYDFPERIPQYVKEAVFKAFNDVRRG